VSLSAPEDIHTGLRPALGIWVGKYQIEAIVRYADGTFGAADTAEEDSSSEHPLVKSTRGC
jgi:hypothetical protein